MKMYGKKAMALVLALAMMLSCGINVFAAAERHNIEYELEYEDDEVDLVELLEEELADEFDWNSDVELEDWYFWTDDSDEEYYDEDLDYGKINNYDEYVIDLDDDAEDELYELEDDIDEAYDELEDLELAVERTEFQVVSLEEQVAAQKDTVEQLDEHYNTLKDKENDYKSAKDRVESCQDTLDDLTFALAEQKKADGKIAASQQLDLDNSLKEIQEQEEIVAKLQSNSTGAEVTAKVSGQISSLNVTAGRDANAGDTLAVIEVVDRGYTVRLPVTNEQSQKVRIGDKATVSNYYWGEELDVTLTQIVNDPSKPGQGKMLVFTINGDVSSGQNVTLSVGERSANYDSIVPNSAVRTDTNGTFVLVLTVKSSPLGNRYIATRVDVNVLAQDDTMAAVSGLSMGDYVITTSSKPLEAGMQVNMVEN